MQIVFVKHYKNKAGEKIEHWQCFDIELIIELKCSVLIGHHEVLNGQDIENDICKEHESVNQVTMRYVVIFFFTC